MNPYLEAAGEINERWHECLRLNGMVPANCPTDDEGAAIIQKHIPPTEESSHA